MKTFIRGLLTTVLVFTFTLIPVVMFAEKAVTEELLGQYMKEELVNNVVDNLEMNLDQLTIEDVETIKQELKNNEEINQIMDKYGTRIIEDLSKENIEDINMEEDLEIIMKENKDSIEKITGEELSDEQLDQAITEITENNDLDSAYKEIIAEAKQTMPTETKTMIDSYNTITSNQFIIIASIISVVSIIIIALLKKPYYKWIVNVGIAGIISSLFIALIGACLALFLNLVIESTEVTFTVSMTPILTTAAIMFVVSIILFIINNVLDKKTGSKA